MFSDPQPVAAGEAGGDVLIPAAVHCPNNVLYDPLASGSWRSWSRCSSPAAAHCPNNVLCDSKSVAAVGAGVGVLVREKI
jgi:hypothetical protein